MAILLGGGSDQNIDYFSLIEIIFGNRKTGQLLVEGEMRKSGTDISNLNQAIMYSLNKAGEVFS